MKRRSKGNGLKVAVLIIPILIAVLIFQAVKINRLNKRLTGITIIEWQEEELSLVCGNEVFLPTIGMSASFINKAFTPQSPFNDGKNFFELIDEFVKYGSNDMYGSPRRTGNIRRIHEGIDLYVPEDTSLYPLFPVGIVTEVSDDPDHVVQTSGYAGTTRIDSVGVEYGKIVRILYPEGIESLYAHLNEVFVEEGQFVTSGTIVGTSGYTGNIRQSGKPSHLHIELRDVENNSFNPENRIHYSQINVDRFINLWQEILMR